MTHILAANQKSQLAQSARLEGKRLVTAYWLNDTILRKKVLPPWKAVHFPLPANFDPPCTNMILTTTGFEGRDKDFIKDMIKMVGASHTGYTGSQPSPSSGSTSSSSSPATQLRV